MHGSNSGGVLCVVFLGKTSYSHAPLFTQVYKWVTANLMLGGALQWTNIPTSRFITETGMSYGPDGPLGSYAHLTINQFAPTNESKTFHCSLWVLLHTHDSVPFLYLKDALYIPLISSTYAPENSSVVTYRSFSSGDSISMTKNWFFSNTKCRLTARTPIWEKQCVVKSQDHYGQSSIKMIQGYVKRETKNTWNTEFIEIINNSCCSWIEHYIQKHQCLNDICYLKLMWFFEYIV